MRIIAEQPNLLLAPIGLMHVNIPGSTPEFVGFVANVQTPLEYQDYSPSLDCISRWVLFVPPEPPPPKVTAPPDLATVFDARIPFKTWISAIKQSCPSCVIDRVDDFQTWLKPGPRESDAVVILSHHKANTLFFSTRPDAPAVLSSAVMRRFTSPSIVILDACGTSEPGASEFIREFNFRGMTSAIATSTEVEPDMAGEFLDKLMTLLQTHQNDASYTVGQARFDAVAALAGKFGAKALAFVLAGNGALRLCVPHE